jgi:hypothetical protein
MTNQFDFAHHLAPYHLIAASLSVTDALDTFEVEDFALLVDEQQPLTVVQKSHLEKIGPTETRPLTELLDLLPPLISINTSAPVLEADELNLLLLLLHQAKAPGLVVKHEQEIVGIVSLTTLAQAVPFSAIAPWSTKGSYGNYGNFLTSPQTAVYICRKCQPPSRVVEKEGSVPPCPIRPFLHKTMEREQ